MPCSTVASRVDFVWASAEAGFSEREHHASIHAHRTQR